jgi:hypothetical protein
MKLKQRCILISFISAAIFTLFILFCISIGLSPNNSHLHHVGHSLGITINVEELTEMSKCPACFGVRLCPAIMSGKVELNDWNKFRLSKLVNARNVFYATWDDRGVKQQIVLKKLAHDHELDSLDKAICDRHGKEDSCKVSDAVVPLIEKYARVPDDHDENMPFVLNGEKIGKGTDVLLCPSHRKMDFLTTAAKQFARGQHENMILANVLTTILLNPEPVLLQAFPAKEGWPFPKYYGGCGRIIAEEYVGPSLTTFYQEPFLIRAQFARQLLSMANKFNENPTNFILYLTDISPENFAVDEKTNMVKVVDLENIVVVDKEILIKSKAKNANQLLVSESVPCEEGGNADQLCFGYLTDDLCERPLSDHNYYAICAGLLAPGALSTEFPDGLLHSLPEELTKSSEFSEILLKCKDPRTQISNSRIGTRVEAAQTLIKLLDEYLAKNSN